MSAWPGCKIVLGSISVDLGISALETTLKLLCSGGCALIVLRYWGGLSRHEAALDSTLFITQAS